MKYSIQMIAAGDAAYAAEVQRLQVTRATDHPGDGGPLPHEVPVPPSEPSEVKMLLEGLRAIEREGE